MTDQTETATCTAYIVNEHSKGTHHCTLDAGHSGGEFDGDHAGPVDGKGVRYCWSDNAIGAVPHESAAAAAVPAPATDRSAVPAVWVDGHPQLEAIATAVWEKCGRSDSGGCVEDDPRNIAVAALAAVWPATVVRAAVLREAADRLERINPDRGADFSEGVDWVLDELRRLAEAQQDEATAEHHTVDGTRYLCHTDDHYCPKARQEPTQDGRTVLWCNWAMTRYLHAPHAWEPQPGMDAVYCPGSDPWSGQPETDEEASRG